MGVSKNNGTPKSSILNRVFHHKPSILGYPYVWKHPNTPPKITVSSTTFNHLCGPGLGRFWPRFPEEFATLACIRISETEKPWKNGRPFFWGGQKNVPKIWNGMEMAWNWHGNSWFMLMSHFWFEDVGASQHLYWKHPGVSYMFLKSRNDPVLMENCKISPFLAIPSSWRDLVKRSIHSCNSVQQPSKKLTLSPLKKNGKAYCWLISVGFFMFFGFDSLKIKKKHLPSAGPVAMGNPPSFPCNTLLKSPKNTPLETMAALKVMEATGEEKIPNLKIILRVW